MAETQATTPPEATDPERMTPIARRVRDIKDAIWRGEDLPPATLADVRAAIAELLDLRDGDSSARLSPYEDSLVSDTLNTLGRVERTLTRLEKAGTGPEHNPRTGIATARRPAATVTKP